MDERLSLYMNCRHCQQRISWLRFLSDRQFCCDDHRKKAAEKSARILRDYPDIDKIDPLAWKEITEEAEKAKRQHAASPSAGMYALGLATVALVLLNYVSGGTSAAQPADQVQKEEKGKSKVWNRMQSGAGINPGPLSLPSIHLKEDFAEGLNNWKPAEGIRNAAQDWTIRAGQATPTSLRIWSNSLKLSDYRLEFDGSIERKAVSWAFRASDAKNYYASKLAVEPGRSEIIRYAVIGGHRTELESLPLPIALKPETFYRIAVKVRGNQFLTTLDGQVIDTWRHSSLTKGGVGFFSEHGEVASIRSVYLSDAADALDNVRNLLSFGFILPTGL